MSSMLIERYFDCTLVQGRATQGWSVRIGIGGTASNNAAIKLYSFDRLGKHLRTSLFYNPPYGGGASAPEVLWNGLEFEMYWLPPENPVLVRSMVSEEGVVRHTSAIALDDPTYVLPRVIQSGSMRTFLWRKNDRLLIDHRPAGENVLSGTPATWRTQTELMPQSSTAGTRSLVLWYEPRARKSPQSGIELVPRAMAIDGDGSRSLVQLPSDACEANALASNETETVMVFSCGAGLRAARLPADTHTFGESDEIVTGNDIRVTPQALTWNGSGWTVVWTTRDGPSQSGFARHVRMLRLAPDLTPAASPISLVEIHELDGAYISSNGTSEIIVTAQVDPEACYILCTGPPAHPVEMLKLGGDGRIIDRWTPLEAGGFTAVPLTIVPDAGGFFLVVGAREVNVVRVTGNAPLAHATVSRFGLAAHSIAATVQGEHLWIAITEASYQWISDGLPIHIYRADLAGGTTKLAEEWSLGGYAGSVTLLDRPDAVPGLISSEITPDPAQGLSPRILLREFERTSRRRAVSHR